MLNSATEAFLIYKYTQEHQPQSSDEMPNEEGTTPEEALQVREELGL